MSKIQAEHLERQALIYVRQSTLMQVRENVGSKERQYGLVQRAIDLGWGKEQIVVVDQDQGRSGASTEGRDGFQQLVPGHDMDRNRVYTLPCRGFCATGVEMGSKSFLGIRVERGKPDVLPSGKASREAS